MYLQTEDNAEQQAMYKRFEEYGAEFARISGEIKKYGNSPEEAKRIAEIDEMQKRILSEAVNLIAIRDGEGAYGPDTKAASAKFGQTAREFVSSIEKLVSVENAFMRAIQDESSGIAAGIRSSIGRSTKIMIVVNILALPPAPLFPSACPCSSRVYKRRSASPPMCRRVTLPKGFQ